MTECCFQSTKTTTNDTITKKNNKLSDFITVFSFILSHPLYLSYLIFFSPYLLKLLSFLSPLFITTSLLVFSLLTTLIPLHSVVNSKEGFFLTVYNTLLEKLHPKNIDDEGGEEFRVVEELEVYKIVFETPIVTEVMEQNPDESLELEENPVEDMKFEEIPDGYSEEKVEEKKTGDHQSEMGPETGDFAKPNKVMEEVKKFESLLMRTGSEANKIIILPTNNEALKPRGRSCRIEDEEKKVSEAFSQTVGSPPYLGSFGSMRKEREWRRTLACKLFEERHNWSHNNGNNVAGNGEEGMDLLWETHETDQSINKSKVKEVRNSNKKGRREQRMEDLMMVNDDEDYDNDDDYSGGGDEEDDNGKFCCLQALKLSAGKMNLNMGRPNLIKIGKAFKGMGWLHSPARRHGKKGYK